MRIKQQTKALQTLCAIFFITVLFLSFTGCELYGKVGGADVNLPGVLPDMLRGEWTYTQPGSNDPAERYIIEKGSPENNEADTVQYGYGGGADPTDYKGVIRFVSNYSEDSGVIIIEYTEAEKPSYPLYNGNSFFGIYYRNLKDNSVQIANSINPDNSAPDTPTLDEAIKKFTRFNMGTFVNWGVVQPQRRVR
jgi:hypothetical protein